MATAKIITPSLDPISLQRIAMLHPKLREDAKNVFIQVTHELTGRAMCRITFTLRTFAEQQALYEIGRTKPGNKVTNAKAGQSLHNYGLALDFAFVIDGKTASWDEKKDWDNDGQADWMEVVTIFQDAGWEWGGRWHTIVDKPHFQKTYGHGWPDLLAAHNAGKLDNAGYVLI